MGGISPALTEKTCLSATAEEDMGAAAEETCCDDALAILLIATDEGAWLLCMAKEADDDATAATDDEAGIGIWMADKAAGATTEDAEETCILLSDAAIGWAWLYANKPVKVITVEIKCILLQELVYHYSLEANWLYKSWLENAHLKNVAIE